MNRSFPRYNSDTDFNTNSPSYYEDLARKQKLIEKLSCKIWEYDEKLSNNLDKINKILDEVLNVIGVGFNDEIEKLLIKWVDDGTLDHIINETLMNEKADKKDVEESLLNLKELFNEEISSLNNEINIKIENDLSYLKNELNDNIKNEVNKINNQMEEIYVNVKNLGAKGDGKQDDYPYIQEALNMAQEGYKLRIFIPTGTYILSDTLRIFKNTSITCDEIGTHLIRDHNGYIITNGLKGDMFDGFDGNGNITIIGGVWDCNGVDRRINGTALAFGHARNLKFLNLTIKDVVDSHAIEINSTDGALVKGCKFLGFIDTGNRSFSEAIQIDVAGETSFPAFGKADGTVCKNIIIKENYFGESDTYSVGQWGCGVGSHGGTSEDDQYDNIKIISNVFDGLTRQAVKTLNWKNVIIKNNTFIKCGGAIYLNVPSSVPCENYIVDSNLIKECGQEYNDLSFRGKNDAKIKNVKIVNNIIENSKGTSSSLYGQFFENVTITGNTINGGSDNSFYAKEGEGLTVESNDISNSESSGIYISTGVKKAGINNNNIQKTGRNGIVVDGYTYQINISNNNIEGVNKDNSDYSIIRVVGGGSDIVISGNIGKDLEGYKSRQALRITSTMENVIRMGNIFKDLLVEDSSESVKLGDII